MIEKLLKLLIIFTIFKLNSAQEGDYFSNGSVNPLSIGGSYISRGECPWLCPIFVEAENGQRKFLCSSSLITNKFVLTAAHCVQPKSFRQTQYLPYEYLIYAGRFNLSKPNEKKSKVIPGKDIKIHEDWDFSSRRYNGDIALIEMQTAVQFSNFLERIALPPPRVQATPGSLGFVVGYGRSESNSLHENVPKRIEIPVVDSETCYQSHVQIGAIKSRNAFCAGKKGSVPCSGDSGGSFYINQNRRPIILGVVSVGISGPTENSCNDDVYALFVDVQNYVEWIKREVGGRGFLIGGKKQGNTGDDKEDENEMGNRNSMWKDGSGFCEYVEDNGYRCNIRGISSTEANFRISELSGNHLADHEDGDVVKLWIVEQKTFFIPELSKVLKKFTRIQDFRIWSSNLKSIERSKLKVFKKIRVLDFFNNLIEEIPEDAFHDLTQLEELILIKNRLKTLPQNLLKNSPRLKWFRAQENEIETLPANFFNSTQIVEVQMSQNNLKKIFVDFKSLRNVNVIDFNSNECISKCLGHYCERISVDEMQREIENKCR